MPSGPERVLITGASGFIGASLARDLMAAGQEIHLLLRPGTDLWRLAGLEDRCTLHWADLRDPPAVRRAVEASRPAVVYHLATHGAHLSQNQRTVILATNVMGTAHLLDALEGHDYRRMVNAGSSSEYGHKEKPIGPEDRIDPRSDYAVGRAAATLLCQAETYRGRPVVTVRIFSAYGPWEDPRRLASYLMGCCRRGELPRVTAGRQPRDFIYIDDVLALLRQAADHPAAGGRILHAGTGRQYCVRDMVETVLAVCGGRGTAQVGAEPTRPDEPASWVADIRQTVALTGWRPRHDLRSGIEHTWAWFQQIAARRAAS